MTEHVDEQVDALEDESAVRILTNYKSLAAEMGNTMVTVLPPASSPQSRV